MLLLYCRLLISIRTSNSLYQHLLHFRKLGGNPEEAKSKEQDFDDAASVISNASSRRRHYLLPTQTTGMEISFEI